jgi:hypothetical protein
MPDENGAGLASVQRNSVEMSRCDEFGGLVRQLGKDQEE